MILVLSCLFLEIIILMMINKGVCCMSYKKKGIQYEYKVMNILDYFGFACVRAPASGSSRKDLPDIICSNSNYTYAIEVKQRNKEKLYIDKSQVEEIMRFSDKFGAIPLIVVKFFKEPFRVFFANNLPHEYSRSYKVSMEDYPLSEKLTEFLEVRSK